MAHFPGMLTFFCPPARQQCSVLPCIPSELGQEHRTMAFKSDTETTFSVPGRKGASWLAVRISPVN